MSNLSSKQDAEKLLKSASWDGLYPIPVQFKGNLTHDGFSKIVEENHINHKDFVFSGDDKCIWTWNPILANEMIKNGHKLEFNPAILAKRESYPARS